MKSLLGCAVKNIDTPIMRVGWERDRDKEKGDEKTKGLSPQPSR